MIQMLQALQDDKTSPPDERSNPLPVGVRIHTARLAVGADQGGHAEIYQEFKQMPDFDEISTKLLTSDHRKLLRNNGLGTAFVAATGLGLFSPKNAQATGTPSDADENQEILRSYAEMSADWLWELDADLRLKPAFDFVTDADDIGKTPRELADPAMHEERWAAHRAELAARRPFRDFRWERIGSNGERLFISTNGVPIFDRNGVFRGYRGTGRDITAEVAATAKLLQLNSDLELGRQHFNAVLNSMSQGVCLFDADKRLVLCNRLY
jgi:PAS domain-containing protein